jgi:hypothetical protein
MNGKRDVGLQSCSSLLLVSSHVWYCFTNYSSRFEASLIIDEPDYKDLIIQTSYSRSVYGYMIFRPQFTFLGFLTSICFVLL